MKGLLNMRNRRHASGFTLIELLLVMVILVVLAAVVVPKFAARGEQARLTAAKTDLTNLETAIDAYEIDNGGYPADLSALVTAPSGAAAWRGPYVKSVPNDPWGQPYNYAAPGSHHPTGFDLWSYGQDKQESPDDVTNWDTATQ
jgi:general secretion pathway protein G